jgi:type IV pilus assembly protein PilX
MKPATTLGIHQRGVTMLVVLVLLSVMLLGGMALAKLTEVGTLASGNTAFREASLQASEVGLNTAFERIREDLVDENTDLAGWYWATMQDTDAHGVPEVDFDAAPEVEVGPYVVRYVAERLCDTADVTHALRQCVVKQEPDAQKSRQAGGEPLDPPNSRQFRVTIQVTGPKDTRTWVQSMITKGKP